MFDSGGKPKICDFGLSRIMDTSGFTTATPSASISYTAPEILEKSFSDDDGSEETSNPPKLTSKEADIYAFAILTAEVCVRLEYRLHSIQSNLDFHGGALLCYSQKQCLGRLPTDHGKQSETINGKGEITKIFPSIGRLLANQTR